MHPMSFEFFYKVQMKHPGPGEPAQVLKLLQEKGNPGKIRKRLSGWGAKKTDLHGHSSFCRDETSFSDSLDEILE